MVQRADFGPFSGQIGPTCDTNYRSSDTEDRRDRKRREAEQGADQDPREKADADGGPFDLRK